MINGSLLALLILSFVSMPQAIAIFLTLIWSFGLFGQNQPVNQIDKNGLKQGYWVVLGKDRPGANCPPEGKVEEGRYKDNRKVGVWIKYYPDGKTPRIQGTYKNNRPNGEYIRYYSNGNPEERGNFNRNDFSGEYWRYYPSGQISYYNPCGKDDLTCDTVYHYRKDGCLSHKDYIYQETYERFSIVYSKKACNVAIDTVTNFEGWAELYDWDQDTMESVQKFRLAYPLQIENIKEALQKTEGNQLDASTPYFWQVVAAGKNALPILTELLTETSLTGVKNDCFTGNYTVGELAFLAIEEIAELPNTVSAEKIKLETVINDCGIFSKNWAEIEKRKEFALALQSHFENHLDNYEVMPLKDGPNSSYKKKFGVRGRLTLRND